MRLRTSLFVAGRYLLGRGGEGGRYLRGAAIGIAVSLVPLVVTLLIADGMIQGITERFVELGTYHAQAIDYTGKPGGLTELAETLVGAGVVEAAWPELQGLGIAVGASGKSGATVRAVSPSFLTGSRVSKYLRAVEGVATLDGPKDALIGEELAKKTGAKVGAPLRLMTVRTDALGRTIPRVASFTVKGIVSSGYRELDALWLFIPYHSSLSLLSPESSSAFVGLQLADPYGDIQANMERIVQVLPKGYALYSWKDLQRTQYASYESTRQLLLFIMSLIVLVAAANVSSATAMLALDRRREIAVLKSFGAEPSFTSSVFIFGGFLSGVLGGVAGIAAGLLISVNINRLIALLELLLNGLSGILSRIEGGIAAQHVTLLDPSYYLESIPVHVEWAPMLVIFAGTVLLATLAAWLPARKAGAQRPLEVLRKV